MDLLKWLRPVVLAVACMASAAQAETPMGTVILTVTGLDATKYPDGKVEFDMAALAALGETQVTTSSIWTDGVHVYTGVLVRVLTDTLGISDKMLQLHALNDYSIEYPAQESTEDGPILAYLFDGEVMSVRDKGPIWVIYPYDADAKYRTDTAFARSIWQLDRIDVMQ